MYKYIGKRKEFKGALAEVKEIYGKFCIRVVSPCSLIVGGRNLSYGWHQANRESWQEIV